MDTDVQAALAGKGGVGESEKKKKENAKNKPKTNKPTEWRKKTRMKIKIETN